ncbi:glycosyltransferase [Dichotomopilus funicola]|uniref:Glycosyltransferase n=1 Tax=Dichotomopilus funicola TaxID=1934379 RepID=A0AAN6V3D9_9PEZI|nr:glycosyltransferase [Dichotomopilus funicola]
MGETKFVPRVRGQRRELGRRQFVVKSLVSVALLLGTATGFHFAIQNIAGADKYLYWFLALFVWRYLRFVVNLIGFWGYSPAPQHPRPTYHPSRDVTVIAPSVAPASEGFRKTIRACADNHQARIIVVTAGEALFETASAYVRTLQLEYPTIKFLVDRTTVASKREQVARAVAYVKTDITVLADDHVYWGPRFLTSTLAAFEDPTVGVVGTNKRVLLKTDTNLWGRIWNMIGTTRLCRNNFESLSTNVVDGGVSVVSGRTSAIRTEILRHPDFLPGYTNELFFFGLFGPLNADDDKYVTRFVVRQGWNVKIQYTEDSVMETTLGVEKPLHTKYLNQCKRWARTTWRSNMCSMVTDRSIWAFQPYCAYAAHLTSLANFAAITDPLLFFLFSRSSAYNLPHSLLALVGWVLFTKMVKVADYFRRTPQNLFLFPIYLAFGYFHSIIKFWAMLTFWDCTWSGRQLDEVNKSSRGANNDGPLALPPTSLPPTPPLSSTEDEDEAGQPKGEHPHIGTFRAIRARITNLRSQQMAHIETYQKPLLSELGRLRDSFGDLHGNTDAIVANHGTIRTELQGVVVKSKELADAKGATAEAVHLDDEISTTITDVKNAVAGVEETWRGLFSTRPAEEEAPVRSKGLTYYHHTSWVYPESSTLQSSKESLTKESSTEESQESEAWHSEVAPSDEKQEET